ncbi:MAG: response regulator [Verrucomicrobiota bacterium]
MKKILVAEDDITTTRLYQMHFRRGQLEGFFFDQGKPAIERAAEINPDLAVLDYELPDLQGIEVMRALHAVPGCQDTPVIFVTGRAKPSLIEELKAAGAVEVVGKPFSPLQLIKRIKELLA